jgi:hypothetical protein
MAKNQQKPQPQNRFSVNNQLNDVNKVLKKLQNELWED